MSIKICFPNRKKKSQTSVSVFSIRMPGRYSYTLGEKKERKNPQLRSFAWKLKFKELKALENIKPDTEILPTFYNDIILSKQPLVTLRIQPCFYNASNLVLMNVLQVCRPNSFLPSKLSHCLLPKFLINCFYRGI